MLTRGSIVHSKVHFSRKRRLVALQLLRRRHDSPFLGMNMRDCSVLCGRTQTKSNQHAEREHQLAEGRGAGCARGGVRAVPATKHIFRYLYTASAPTIDGAYTRRSCACSRATARLMCCCSASSGSRGRGRLVYGVGMYILRSHRVDRERRHLTLGAMRARAPPRPAPPYELAPAIA